MVMENKEWCELNYSNRYHNKRKMKHKHNFTMIRNNQDGTFNEICLCGFERLERLE